MKTVKKPKQSKPYVNLLSLKKDYESSMELFTDAHVLVTTLEKKRLAADGTLKPMSLDFSEASYIEATRSLTEYVDILAEVSDLESVVEGVRLEIGSVRGDMGVKDP